MVLGSNCFHQLKSQLSVCIVLTIRTVMSRRSRDSLDEVVAGLAAQPSCAVTCLVRWSDDCYVPAGPGAAAPRCCPAYNLFDA